MIQNETRQKYKQHEKEKNNNNKDQYGRTCGLLFPTDVGVSVIADWLFMFLTAVYQSGLP